MSNLRVRTSPQGSGSVGGTLAGFVDVRGEDVLDKGQKREGKVWQATGVDMSGASGSELLMAIVGGDYGVRERPIAWRFVLPKLSEAEISITDDYLVLKPKGAKHVLRIDVPAPAVPVIEHTQEGNQSMITIWRRAADKGNAFTWEEKNPLDGMSLEDPDAVRTRDLKPRLDQEAAVKAKLGLHVTSNSMGAPTKKKRIASQTMLILRWNKWGQAFAPLELAPGSAEELFTVGEQKIYYREFMIDFERGMRDELRAAQQR